MSVQKSVVLGSDSLKTPNIISESVVIGCEAGNQHRNGEQNVMIGKSAGKFANGSSNVYIGTNAGHNCQGSGNIVLGSVSQQNMMNTFAVGKMNMCPIVASFDTGVVKVHSLLVENDIEFKGSLKGNIQSNVVRTYGTNVGNKCELLKGSNLVCFGENRAYNGNDVIAIGQGAADENYSSDIIAIGKNAACKNNGSNVIAIGANTGVGNIRSNMLFIGDSVECDSTSFHIHRNTMHAGGCVFENGNIRTKNGVEITPSSIKLGDSSIDVNSGEFLISKPITITKPLSKTTHRYVFQNEEGVFVNGKNVHTPFKKLFKWKNMFVGLGKEGHVYTSKTGINWTPIRSPNLSILSYDDKLLYGWGNEKFYRYEENEWFEETREKGDYICYEMCGPYAFGTHLSNDLYEDSGTILHHVGKEWQLYPGKYPQNFKCISEFEGRIYAGGDNGLYLLEDRKAARIYPKKVTCIVGDTFVSESRLHSIHDGMLLWFCNSTILNAIDGLILTTDGVYFQENKIYDGKYDYGFMDYGYLPSTDLNIPSSMRLGEYVLNTEESGISITDGLQKGKIYDSLFNTIPMQLEGIRTITIKKNIDGYLIFECVDEFGNITGYKLDSLQNNYSC